MDALKCVSQPKVNCSISWRSWGYSLGVGSVSCQLQLLAYLTLSDLPVDLQTKKIWSLPPLWLNLWYLLALFL